LSAGVGGKVNFPSQILKSVQISPTYGDLCYQIVYSDHLEKNYVFELIRFTLFELVKKKTQAYYKDLMKIGLGVLGS